MWIVALALRRPYTFVVMALLIIILTPITILRTPVDIFPDINIPVISVVWNFDGMSPDEMANRIVSNSERGYTITVNDIEHQESTSVTGKAVIKIFFRPGVNISMAMTQVTAMCQTDLARIASGHDAAAGDHLFGIDHADRATGLEQQDVAGAPAVRSGQQFSAYAIGHGAGRGDSVPIRRQDHGRSRWIWIP